jgi:hypothetical protein
MAKPRVNMAFKPELELTESQYWWVVLASLLAPLLAIAAQTAWVFRREIRQYQALVFSLNEPLFWLILGGEFLTTMVVFILCSRVLKNPLVRWSLLLCFCALWTYVAFLQTPQVHRLVSNG